MHVMTYFSIPSGHKIPGSTFSNFTFDTSVHPHLAVNNTIYSRVQFNFYCENKISSTTYLIFFLMCSFFSLVYNTLHAGKISGFSVLFHWSICLSPSLHHNEVTITINLTYNSSSFLHYSFLEVF